jgi:hypothetical protein
MSVDVKHRVAAVNAGQLMIFERNRSTWRRVATLPSGGNLDLEIEAGTIVVSEPACAWEAFRKVGSAWARVGVASASNTCNPNPGFSEDIDISGTRIVMANPFISSASGTQWPSRVRVFEGISSSTPAAFITDPVSEDESGFGIPVAVDKATIFAGLGAAILAFERDSAGVWVHRATLEPADSLVLACACAVQSRDGITAVGYPADPQRGNGAGSVGVFRRDTADTHAEVARLLASDAVQGASLGTDVDVDGFTIAAAARDAAYIFRLPPRLRTRP